MRGERASWTCRLAGSRCSYRGQIVNADLDKMAVCVHNHRNAATAMQCAERMLTEREREQERSRED